MIPTRDRFQYLSSCVDTAFEFGRDNDTEVVVSVNGTVDDYNIALKFLGFRTRLANVRIICTNSTLSMIESFDFALRQATGRYITSLGDDDAVMFCYRDKVDAHFDAHPSSILTWYRSAYYWNDTPAPGLLAGCTWDDPKKIIIKEKLEEIRSRSVSYNDLPNIYNSFIPKKLLDYVRNKNLIFSGSDSIYPSADCCAPDIFSGIQNIYYLKGEYWLARAPVTISCISARSNGLAAQSKNASNNEAMLFNRENKMDSFETMTEKYLIKTNSVQMYNAAIQVFAHKHFSKICSLPSWVPTRLWLMNLIDAYISCEAREYPEYASSFVELQSIFDLNYKTDLLEAIERSSLVIDPTKSLSPSIYCKNHYSFKNFKNDPGYSPTNRISLEHSGCINSFQAVLYYEAIYENA